MTYDISIAELRYCAELTNPDAESRLVALFAAVDAANGDRFLYLSTANGMDVRDPFVRTLLAGTPPGLALLIDSLLEGSTDMSGEELVRSLADVLRSSVFVSRLEHRRSVVLPDVGDGNPVDSDTLFGRSAQVEPPALLRAG